MLGRVAGCRPLAVGDVVSFGDTFMGLRVGNALHFGLRGDIALKIAPFTIPVAGRRGRILDDVAVVVAAGRIRPLLASRLAFSHSITSDRSS
jgi:hypothetical protein